MAWSDNIMVFANSVRHAAKSLAAIAEQLELRFHSIKEDSFEIVPASTRRYVWPSTKVGPYTIPVVDESRCLGYHVSCNGDTGTSRASMLGTLRGGVASLRRRLIGTPSVAKARWWKSHFHGVVGFFAAFTGINRSIFQSVGVPSNAAARLIGG